MLKFFSKENKWLEVYDSIKLQEDHIEFSNHNPLKGLRIYIGKEDIQLAFDICKTAFRSSREDGTIRDIRELLTHVGIIFMYKPQIKPAIIHGTGEIVEFPPEGVEFETRVKEYYLILTDRISPVLGCSLTELESSYELRCLLRNTITLKDELISVGQITKDIGNQIQEYNYKNTTEFLRWNEDELPKFLTSQEFTIHYVNGFKEFLIMEKERYEEEINRRTQDEVLRWLDH